MPLSISCQASPILARPGAAAPADVTIGTTTATPAVAFDAMLAQIGSVTASGPVADVTVPSIPAGTAGSVPQQTADAVRGMLATPLANDATPLGNVTSPVTSPLGATPGACGPRSRAWADANLDDDEDIAVSSAGTEDPQNNLAGHATPSLDGSRDGHGDTRLGSTDDRPTSRTAADVAAQTSSAAIDLAVMANIAVSPQTASLPADPIPRGITTDAAAAPLSDPAFGAAAAEGEPGRDGARVGIRSPIAARVVDNLPTSAGATAPPIHSTKIVPALPGQTESGDGAAPLQDSPQAAGPQIVPPATSPAPPTSAGGKDEEIAATLAAAPVPAAMAPRVGTRGPVLDRGGRLGANREGQGGPMWAPDTVAKIAGRDVDHFAPEPAAFREAKKTFVSTNLSQLTSTSPGLGIDVAELRPTMPATLAPHSALSSVATHVVPAAETTGAGSPAAPALPMVPMEATTAHRAVDAVLNAVDRFSSRNDHTVNLQFSVGGSDLNVRIELRANEVHATFRTESAELRAALAQEWQSATGNASDRGVRLAPAVFAGGDAALANAGADSGSSQRDARGQAAEPTTAQVWRVGAVRPTAGSSVATAAGPALRGSETSLHLQAVA